MNETKILVVSSGWDYGVVTFENSKLTKEEMFKKCIENNGSYTEKILEDGEEMEIDFIAKIFPLVPKEFIDFIESEKDYDDTKHNNWFVI